MNIYKSKYLQLLKLDTYYINKFKKYSYSFYSLYFVFVGLILSTNYLLGLAVDSAVSLNLKSTLLFSLLFLFSMAMLNIINFLSEYISDIYKKLVEFDIIERIIKNNTATPREPGEVISRISSDVENAVGAIVISVWIIFVIVRIVATFLFASSISLELAILILPFVVVYGLLTYFIGPRLMRARSEEREYYAHWFKRLKESIEAGLSLCRVNILGVPKIYVTTTAEYFGKFKRFTFYNRGLMFLANMPVVIGPNLIFVLAVINAINGMGTVGEAVALRGVLSNLFEPVAHLAATVGSYYVLVTSYERIAPLLESRAEKIETAPYAEFKNAVFKYDGRTVLYVEELAVRPGDFIWVRGP
ncbi:ABC transporter transmembrane domain-containing protein [Pyrobaculum aerophilum]|uniref:ABC transporter transmembrane domain-containing protein n=1 Tax=Pyrobaculum aerophilum TaxID=13773 RepID=UPI0023F4C98C|nr:ABC transporter ATP-binding protein [Pyrobaculum aerophilum]MCX8135843.1 ABC transporter ATP-binding protein/permease [Pyrobaculum aerophilum]